MEKEIESGVSRAEFDEIHKPLIVATVMLGDIQRQLDEGSDVGVELKETLRSA